MQDLAPSACDPVCCAVCSVTDRAIAPISEGFSGFLTNNFHPSRAWALCLTVAPVTEGGTVRQWLCARGTSRRSLSLGGAVSSYRRRCRYPRCPAADLLPAVSPANRTGLWLRRTGSLSKLHAGAVYWVLRITFSIVLVSPRAASSWSAVGYKRLPTSRYGTRIRSAYSLVSSS